MPKLLPAGQSEQLSRTSAADFHFPFLPHHVASRTSHDMTQLLSQDFARSQLDYALGDNPMSGALAFLPSQSYRKPLFKHTLL